MNIEKIIKEGKGTIIDVRSPEEFRGGNVKGSINIPLQQVPQRMEELKRMKAPLVLCCASGNRSGQAHAFLVQQGIECYNGGSWMDVHYCQTETT
ncbi:MAG: rhodanese-like domain-containing protein [Bacteroidia bacterium]|nr:rhodanese-like domain-containing protein [Bacteroidia bacterium]